MQKLRSWFQAKPERRSRGRRSRQLRAESLETRKLLAADFFHNQLIPEDVNNDGRVSAQDALVVINQMNRHASRDIDTFTDVNQDGQRSAVDALMVINRLNRRDSGGDRLAPPIEDRLDGPVENPVDIPTDTQTGDPTSDLSDEVRSIDGTGNNLENPALGSTDESLLRVANADYADGISEPAGEDRPSAREISNTVSATDLEGTSSERDLSSFLFIWGQFLDHDIDASHAQEGDEAESFDIEVPTGDPLFDPFSTGEQTIPLTRSAIAEGTGTSIDNPAEQLNAITAWIDGSQIYGSDQEVADSLREFVGGRMLISEEGLLPTDDAGNVLAGDIRAAENIALTSMHALFIREHNRIADELSTANSNLTDEEIYQEARATVIAELQSITFNEFLPALLGENAIADYTGYDATVDPSIANEFSTAAFRFGHTTINDTVGFVGNDGLEVQEAISLAEAFFNPSLLEETGIDSILKSGASTISQETDLEVVDSLRNFLFGAPGSGGLDLVSLNIQRGRDHGLADFNSVRVAYGFDAYDSFSDITSDVELQGKLETLYGDVNNIDLWVGLMAEDHANGSSLGETSTLIVADQFERLRDGDRLWYQNTLSGSELREIENTTLADVIERNSNVNSLQANVFFFAPTIVGKVTAADAIAQTDQSQTQLSQTQQARPQQLGRQDGTDRGRNDRPQQSGSMDVPMAGMTIELLDSEGNMIDSTVTDQNGVYRFDSFDNTGEYQIRIASDEPIDVNGSDTLSVLVSTGNATLRGYDFQVIV
ncbi:peroxidase family protein [Novipirellula herctigrandis]